MSELNESQKRLAETTDGMVCVDAGPGTGKTHTIVQRYINIISKSEVAPPDVLLLTFTRNAAAEMDERIKNEMTSAVPDGSGGTRPNPLRAKVKLVQAKTFDSFCTSVVMDSPEDVGRFFGIEEKLTRGAALCENDTLNREYFRRFLDQHLRDITDFGLDYGPWPAIASQRQDDILRLIEQLMSRGVYPLKKGWFGPDHEAVLRGDSELLLRLLSEFDTSEDGKPSEAMERMSSYDQNDYGPLPETRDGQLSLGPEVLREAAFEDRSVMLGFIHDVYHAYIRKSITDNRLTFGLNAMFAFTLLYRDRQVRERSAFRYLMIDEFQDTNASQLMIALMIMSKPNLCVVGDWKQGIYGFRYVSIANITLFEERVVAFRRFLNEDGTERVPFRIPEVRRLSLDVNYRSSQLVVDRAFDCLYLQGSEKDAFDRVAVDENVIRLTAGRDDIGSDTSVRFVKCEQKDEETKAVASAIRDYISPGRYVIHVGNGTRPVSLRDIAVICRTGRNCRAVLEELQCIGVPAYMQGDVEVMSTREGKLALAWLRYVNNEGDPWGYMPILVDLGFNLNDIHLLKKHPELVPAEVREQRQRLYRRRRRITELMTSIFSFYGLDNDITQTIIWQVSRSHRNSLLTISDVIRIIEEDIESHTSYEVENSIDREAVTIMTMHKSKGLEYPVVIIPFIDDGTMPSRGNDRGKFQFTPELGVRCTEEVDDFGGYTKICKSWRTDLAKAAIPRDYSEERRLMFVAVSRAKQYVTVISGPKPSLFMKQLSGGNFSDIPPAGDSDLGSESELSEKPILSGYVPRRLKLGVHDVMVFKDEEEGATYQLAGEACGKGMEYGTQVHLLAHRMQLMMPLQDWEMEKYPETVYIRKVLDRVSDAGLESEIECGLPLEGADVTLRGIIDLLAVYGDRIEVHDYKTDTSDRFEAEYRLQLSIYARAAEGHYGRPARCFIDYVSQGRTVEFEPMTVAEITGIVMARIRSNTDAEGSPLNY